MVTLLLLTLGLLIIIGIVLLFVITSPVAILVLLFAVIDIAVLGGIFGRKKNDKKEEEK